MLVVPVYNMILTPDATVFFQSLTEDSFYPIGVAGTITEINQQGIVMVRTQYRVDIESVGINPDHTFQLTISRRNDIDDLDEAVEAEKLKNLRQEMRDFSAGFQWGASADVFINQISTIGMAACAMSPWLKLTNEERYAILAEDSRAARAERIEEILYDFLEVGRITNEAVSSQQQEQQQMYRESAIKRQMEHLQKELDEMHPENVSDIQKFEKKIAESGMNETARREAEKVLNRLKQERRESAESGLLYDYLDFVTGLSWKKEEANRIDLDVARKILGL